TAAARQRTRAAGRPAEGPSLCGEDGRAAAAPGERGREGFALAGGDTLLLAASEHAPAAGPRVAPGAEARGDLVAARLPTLPRDGGSVRGVGEIQRREQREQRRESQSLWPWPHRSTSSSLPRAALRDSRSPAATCNHRTIRSPCAVRGS